MARFTDEQVFATLREVVAERPEHVYEKPEGWGPDGAIQCFYVHPDGPGCLVGQVMHRLGVSLEEMSQHEGSGPYVFQRAGHISHFAADVLETAQSSQDEGDTWGDALSAAERHMEDAA